ncbi:MAG: glycosyltransferase family 39 protein [Myxococcaceae bacterium]|nr:glycosyltransferase family 39 protein [Myxococcaceae bacterium]
MRLERKCAAQGKVNRQPSAVWQTSGVLAVLAVGAFLLRVAPFLRFHGALAVPLDYDEGVYFSAGALWAKGVWPYRDFVFVHPPGIAYLWNGWSVLFEHVRDALASARWWVALLGALNTWLLGRVAMRWFGAFAGLAAAALYATYGEAVMSERGPFLEPWLNLFCLLALWLLARARADVPLSRRTLWGIGALMGAALTVKLWALFWLAALTWGVGRRGGVKALAHLAGGCAVVLVALWLPVMVSAPAALFEQTVAFHLWRPADANPERLRRLREIAGTPHLATVVLSLLGLLRVLGSREQRERTVNQVALAGWFFTLAALLASKSYWSQYNAHLAVADALLGGAGAAWLLERAQWRWPSVPGPVAGVALALMVAVPGTVWVLRHAAKMPAPDVERLAWLQRDVPATTCVFSFEPGDNLLADRLPPHGSRTPTVVDTYAVQLLDAKRGGERFVSAAEAFATPAAQTTVRQVLTRCPVVLGSWRLDFQLNAQSKTDLARDFTDNGRGAWLKR